MDVKESEQAHGETPVFTLQTPVINNKCGKYMSDRGFSLTLFCRYVTVLP